MNALERKMRRKYTVVVGTDGKWMVKLFVEDRAQWDSYCETVGLSAYGDKDQAERMRDRLAEALARIVEEEKL